MAVEIRVVGADDAPVVRDLRLRGLAEDPASFGSHLAREQEYTEERWREWVTGSNVSPLFATFVAFVDGRPAGLVISCRDEERPRRFHVLAMWVAPEARRRGVARALLAEAERWAAERGAQSIVLGVTDAAAAAAALYAAAGYRPTGRTEPLSHMPGVTEIELTKPL